MLLDVTMSLPCSKKSRTCLKKDIIDWRVGWRNSKIAFYQSCARKDKIEVLNFVYFWSVWGEQEWKLRYKNNEGNHPTATVDCLRDIKWHTRARWVVHSQYDLKLSIACMRIFMGWRLRYLLEMTLQGPVAVHSDRRTKLMSWTRIDWLWEV